MAFLFYNRVKNTALYEEDGIKNNGKTNFERFSWNVSVSVHNVRWRRITITEIGDFIVSLFFQAL